ncbi:hypothetical protein EVAR_28795_1 [Eumeta japonica]|uniref:Uncharacterized protein n=1 Tax=Eumeta variegata TaxID=151549 RepID=A0A4C1VGS8_EUMVA|nr:hypothetical protein EVAR_28795_1 [Eumeta japonica]
MKRFIWIRINTVTAISPLPPKAAFRISSLIASENGFLAAWVKMRDNVCIQTNSNRYFSTSFRCGGRSTTATDALFFCGSPNAKGEGGEKLIMSRSYARADERV